MDHRLLVASLVVAEVGVLLERLADAGDVAVAEDAEAAGEEGLLHAVALGILLLQERDQRLCHRQTERCLFAHASSHSLFSRQSAVRSRQRLSAIAYW